MTLTKRDIARCIHEAEPEISVAEAVSIVDEIFEMIKQRLALGEKVMVTNFGTFDIVTRLPRRGVDPSTGRRMTIPSHRAVTFHAAPAMQKTVDD